MKRIEGEALPTPAGIPRHKVDAGEDLMAALVPLVIFGAIVAGLLRRAFGTPGAAVTSVGVGALAGVLLTSLVIGAIAAVAVFVFSAFMGGGGGGRVLGGRRGGPIIIPGGWSGGGGWGGGGGGGWSSGGGGDFRWWWRRQQLVGRHGNRSHPSSLDDHSGRGAPRVSGGHADPHPRRRSPRARAAHSGEIRFAVEAALPWSYLRRDAPARERAAMIFSKLRVWDTDQNNGVLIYVELADHQIEIVADRGIGRLVTEGEWTAIAASDARAVFRPATSKPVPSTGIQAVGALLSRHFPLADGERNPNELPDHPLVL